MSFKIHSIDDNRISGIEYLPCGAITPKDSPCTAGDIIPVIRVNKDMIFETTFAAAATSVKLGSKVTLHTDGLQVTGTTASGVAEVVYMDGTAAGDMCRVRF